MFERIFLRITPPFRLHFRRSPCRIIQAVDKSDWTDVFVYVVILTDGKGMAPSTKKLAHFLPCCVCHPTFLAISIAASMLSSA
jgi:hypothetical protein